MITEQPTPRTQYVEADGLSIAYQVFGSGPQDLVIVPGLVSHIEADWSIEEQARARWKLAQAFRVIVFDKRGQGMSDAFEGVPTLEERISDVRAVMQAVGSKRAVLFALSEGGAMSVLFAATYPQMVERLILFGSMARATWAPDYPHRRTLEDSLAWLAANWGTPDGVKHFGPSRADDASFLEAGARYQRLVASDRKSTRLNSSH